MTQTMTSPVASSRPIKTYSRTVSATGIATDVAAAVATSDAQSCVVLSLESHPKLQVIAPAKHRRMNDITKSWEQNETRRKAMEEARQWVGEVFHGDDGYTVRTLRLRKGWSQTQLAEAIGTSQSHVARIERGRENLAIQTCRRLSDVLGIDMNTLDRALRQQETLALAKVEK
jgi:ribosome-binding protein aMBF1 (putative translation factor)